jgi:hypothetical protein
VQASVHNSKIFLTYLLCLGIIVVIDTSVILILNIMDSIISIRIFFFKYEYLSAAVAQRFRVQSPARWNRCQPDISRDFSIVNLGLETQ